MKNQTRIIVAILICASLYFVLVYYIERLWVLASTEPSQPPHGPYKGKYLNRPEIKQLQKRLPKIKADATEAIEASLGIPPVAPDRVALGLIDVENLPEGVSRGSRGFVRWLSGYKAVEILLVTEYFITGTMDVEEVVTHEMTHAQMRLHMGYSAYKRIPKWLREGLALYTSGEGPGRVGYLLGIVEQPEDLVNGLEEKHTFDDHAEDFLAIQYIEKQYGSEAVKKLSRLLLNRVPYRKALQEVTGLSWPSFEKAAQAYALSYIQSLAQGKHERYRKIIKDFRPSQYARVAEEARKFLAEFPHAYCAGTVTYYLGKSLYFEGRLPEAAEEFRKVLTNYSRTCGYVDDAKYFLALSLLHMGKIDEALKEIRDYQCDFVFDQALCRGILLEGDILKQAGEKEGAVLVYRRLYSEYPNDHYAPMALFREARCHREMKRPDEEKKALNALLKGYPKSHYAEKARSRLRELARPEETEKTPVTGQE
ncbi:MAG: hypothetical protein AMS15_06130 [Planctomycetes bacterium DG_23]|nr:MAG: hypothetical protein AMS15_06130 [Planctomycetes bacterium DG_23]